MCVWSVDPLHVKRIGLPSLHVCQIPWKGAMSLGNSVGMFYYFWIAKCTPFLVIRSWYGRCWLLCFVKYHKVPRSSFVLRLNMFEKLQKRDVSWHYCLRSTGFLLILMYKHNAFCDALQTYLSLRKMGWFFGKHHYFCSCVHGATSALTGEILHHALSLGQRCTLESNETVDCSSSTLPTCILFKTFSTGFFFSNSTHLKFHIRVQTPVTVSASVSGSTHWWRLSHSSLEVFEPKYFLMYNYFHIISPSSILTQSFCSQ